MQTRQIFFVNTCTVFVDWKKQNFSEKYNVLPFEKCAEQ